jgi:dual oxidase
VPIRETSLTFWEIIFLFPDLLDFGVDSSGRRRDRYAYEKQRYDGWFNNMAHPDWGSVGEALSSSSHLRFLTTSDIPDSRLSRRTPAAYADGVYMMAGPDRPSPRKLSQVFMKGDDGMGSARNRTALLAFFGQVVTADILMASENGCPLEIHSIEIDKCDEMYDQDCQGVTYMPFYRAKYDPQTGQSPNSPREQVRNKWLFNIFLVL